MRLMVGASKVVAIIIAFIRGPVFGIGLGAAVMALTGSENRLQQIFWAWYLLAAAPTLIFSARVLWSPVYDFPPLRPVLIATYWNGVLIGVSFWIGLALTTGRGGLCLAGGLIGFFFRTLALLSGFSMAQLHAVRTKTLEQAVEILRAPFPLPDRIREKALRTVHAALQDPDMPPDSKIMLSTVLDADDKEGLTWLDQ